MKRISRDMAGWALLSFCGVGAGLMNAARVQYLNFTIYVALCICASALLVISFRWLYRPEQERETATQNTSKQ